MAIIKIKTKIELSEKELTGFRAAIEKIRQDAESAGCKKDCSQRGFREEGG